MESTFLQIAFPGGRIMDIPKIPPDSRPIGPIEQPESEPARPAEPAGKEPEARPFDQDEIDRRAPADLDHLVGQLPVRSPMPEIQPGGIIVEMRPNREALPEARPELMAEIRPEGPKGQIVEMRPPQASGELVVEMRPPASSNAPGELMVEMRPPQASGEPMVEMRPNVVNEIRPEIVPEIRPELMTEVRPEIRPEIRPELKPELRPEIRPEIVPEVRPEIIEEVKSETQPEDRRGIPGELHPEGRADEADLEQRLREARRKAKS
jgi:hypothetical protein